MKETTNPMQASQKPPSMVPSKAPELPAAERSPKAKLAAALAAKLGPKGKQQGFFMKNVQKG